MKRQVGNVPSSRKLFLGLALNEISNKMKDSDFKSIVKKVRKGDLDPYEGAEKFISKLI